MEPEGDWICSITILASMTLEIKTYITRVLGKEKSNLTVTLYNFISL
jgi:hypothetical protein